MNAFKNISNSMHTLLGPCTSTTNGFKHGPQQQIHNLSVVSQFLPVKVQREGRGRRKDMCNQIIAAQCRGVGHASASSHLTPSWYSKYLFVSIHHDRDVLEHQVHPLPVASGVPLKPHLSSSGPAIRGTMGSYDGWSLCVHVCVYACVCMCVCVCGACVFLQISPLAVLTSAPIVLPSEYSLVLSTATMLDSSWLVIRTNQFSDCVILFSMNETKRVFNKALMMPNNGL